MTERFESHIAIGQEGMRQRLRRYANTNEGIRYRAQLEDLINGTTDLYARGDSLAHVTSSSWILSADTTKVVLIEHAKYNIMVPPGGHVDPEEDAYIAAVRETEEEVGLSNLVGLSSSFFHVDVHKIPESPSRKEPAHWHVNTYYPFWNQHDSSVSLNEVECLSHRWVNIVSLLYSKDATLRVMAKKSLDLVDRLNLRRG